MVAAVDKIEALMRTFLTEHTVPGIMEELLGLAGVARDALGTDDVAKSEVDEVGLLRRPDRASMHLRPRHQPDGSRTRSSGSSRIHVCAGLCR